MPTQPFSELDYSIRPSIPLSSIDYSTEPNSSISENVEGRLTPKSNQF